MRRVTLRHLLCMGMGRASCGLWGDRYDRLRRDFAASPAASDMRAVAERFASGREYFDDDLPVVRHLLEDDLPGTGIALGGAGLNLTVRKIAAAGQLWLRGGVLPDGRRLIPAA